MVCLTARDCHCTEGGPPPAGLRAASAPQGLRASGQPQGFSASQASGPLTLSELTSLNAVISCDLTSNTEVTDSVTAALGVPRPTGSGSVPVVDSGGPGG